MRNRLANSSCVKPKARRMIFACGVRFMRFTSALLKGRASGSASAARSMAICVIGRSSLWVFLEIGFLLMFRRPPGGYDSDSVLPFGIGHIKKVCGNQAYDHETLFAIVLPVVKKLDSERVFKDLFSQVKSHSMPLEVVLCLGLVPFELQSHSTGYQ